MKLITEFMLKISQLCILSLCIAGSIAQAQTPQSAQKIPAMSNINTTPDLSSYKRYEIYSQSTQSAQTEGRLIFIKNAAQFEVITPDGGSIAHFSVQPDACRDDPSAECERRFVITGRLQAFSAYMNCSIPVRNDVNIGYKGQALSGVCQSQYGRTYTIQIYSN